MNGGQLQPPPAEFYTPGKDSMQYRMQSSALETKEVFDIKRSDRSRVQVTITQNSMFATTANLQAIVDPFVPFSPEQLQAFAVIYGPGVVAFCQNKQGQHVGNGECWTLAQQVCFSFL
jgi:hypothetical protein